MTAVGAAADVIAAFLARRDVKSPADAGAVDVVVVCGSAVLATVDTAAAAARCQRVPRVIVTGGVGHSTPFLYDAVHKEPRYRDLVTESRSEAAIIAEALRRYHGVADAAIEAEEASTNCGENAEFTAGVLRGDADIRSILLIQDPTMQRRTHASFERFLRGSSIEVRSFAPFLPRLAGDAVLDNDGRVVWTGERFVSLLLGEVRRLSDTADGYGPSGADFIDHIDIPPEVTLAHERLAATYPYLMR